MKLLPGRASEELLERVTGGARQRQARQANADARRPPAYGGPLGETVPAYEGEVSPMVCAEWPSCWLRAWQAPCILQKDGRIEGGT